MNKSMKTILIGCVSTITLSMFSSGALATPNTKVDVFRDCDIGGCGAANPLDMTGPGDQGFVNYNQDDETGDLRLVVKLQKSGQLNSTYTVFLVCGPGGVGTPHLQSCGFNTVAVFSTNIKGTGNTGDIIIPKCNAEMLLAGDIFTVSGYTGHLDVLAGVGNQSLGLFVSTPIMFDPSVGPDCGFSPLSPTE